MLFKLCLRVLFLLPPECAHHIALTMLSWLHKCHFLPAAPQYKGNTIQVFGLTFDNPLGIAAGLDKNGDHIDALGALGFGFIEVGTVTPKAQLGNPKPRLFRLLKDQALINRMGFNNKGVMHLCKQLKQRQYKGIVGVNIGKNRDTPLENAVDDYLFCMQQVYSLADYIVINLSSPNTPGLRQLQQQDHLHQLLQRLKQEQAHLHHKHQRYVPLVLKVADLEPEAIADVANALITHQMDGLTISNTLLTRENLTDAKASEQGGLSGVPIMQKATEAQQAFATLLQGKVPIIGVGGIFNGDDAEQKFAHGASLIQIYTGFIYRGPALIDEILRLE